MAAYLTVRDNGTTVAVHVGHEVVVSLPENPSTGYRWAVDILDPGLITIREQRYAPDSAAVGSGGETRWVLIAIAPGLTPVRLKEWRPWEGDVSVVSRYEVTLRIVP